LDLSQSNHGLRLLRRQDPQLIDGKDGIVHKLSRWIAIPGPSAMGISTICKVCLTIRPLGAGMGMENLRNGMQSQFAGTSQLKRTAVKVMPRRGVDSRPSTTAGQQSVSATPYFATFQAFSLILQFLIHAVKSVVLYIS